MGVSRTPTLTSRSDYGGRHKTLTPKGSEKQGVDHRIADASAGGSYSPALCTAVTLSSRRTRSNDITELVLELETAQETIPERSANLFARTIVRGGQSGGIALKWRKLKRCCGVGNNS
jgi:hypothetical protein